LTVEYASETVARYRVTYEADGHSRREVGEPRFYATGHASPQPFLPALGEVDLHPAWRLCPYRPRRKRATEGRQERLFDREGEASVG
jgi:hypothetical protein